MDEPSPQVEYTMDSWKDDYKFEVDVEATMQYNAYVKNELENNYPINYVVIHAVLLSALNIGLMVIQVVAMQQNAALAEMGLAIWVGIYNLVIACLALSTIKYRNETLISWTATMSLFGMMLSFAGFIFVNMIALYNYNCIESTYHRHCYNVAIKPIHYVFIVLGTPAALLSLVFFIYFKLKIRIGRPV